MNTPTITVSSETLAEWLAERSLRCLTVEPFRWSSNGPKFYTGYFHCIAMAKVWYEENPNHSPKLPLRGWHTQMRHRQSACTRWQRHGPFADEATAKLMAVITTRAFISACQADTGIDWSYEDRPSGHFGDWHGYAQGIEIAHIIRCDGKGQDYQAKEQWRGWFGAGIFGQGNDDTEANLNAARQAVGVLWRRWVEVAAEVATWGDPFFQPPAAFVWGERHREKSWQGQMLMEGDGI